MTENDDLKFIYDNDEEEKKPEETVGQADELGVEKYEDLVAEDVAVFDYFEEEKKPEMSVSGNAEESESAEENDDNDGERAFKNLVRYMEEAGHEDDKRPFPADAEAPKDESDPVGDDDEIELNWDDVDAELNSEDEDVDKALSSLLGEKIIEEKLQAEYIDDIHEKTDDEDSELRHFVDDILLGGEK